MSSHQETLEMTFALDGNQQLIEYSPPPRKASGMPKPIVWRVENPRNALTKRARKRRPKESTSRVAKTSSTRDASGKDFQIYVADRSIGIITPDHSANDIPITVEDPDGSISNPVDIYKPSDAHESSPGLGKYGQAGTMSIEFNSPSRASPFMSLPANQVSYAVGLATHALENHAIPGDGNALHLSLHPESTHDQDGTGSHHTEMAPRYLNIPASQPTGSVELIQGSTSPADKRAHNVVPVYLLQCTHCGQNFSPDDQQAASSPCLDQTLDAHPWPSGDESSYFSGPVAPEIPHQLSAAEFCEIFSQDQSEITFPNITLIPPTDVPNELMQRAYDQPQSRAALPPLQIPNSLEHRQSPSTYSLSASTESSSELFPTPKSTVSYNIPSPYQSPNSVDGYLLVNQIHFDH